jgi:hypothetical protein
VIIAPEGGDAMLLCECKRLSPDRRGGSGS